MDKYEERALALADIHGLSKMSSVWETPISWVFAATGSHTIQLPKRSQPLVWKAIYDKLSSGLAPCPRPMDKCSFCW